MIINFLIIIQEIMSKNIREININQIKIHDPFWSAMQHRMTDTVIPFQEKVLNDEVPGVEKSHAIENFRIAAGLSEGEFTVWSFRTVTSQNG